MGSKLILWGITIYLISHYHIPFWYALVMLLLCAGICLRIEEKK